MMKNDFQPDYNNLLDVLHNRKPKRLPLYEHIIDVPFVSKAIGKNLEIQSNALKDMEAYYSELIAFWKEMTYDGFAYEAAICEILPDHGAIKGGRPGPIQNRKDFENYPFDEVPKIFWDAYTPHLEAIRKVMPNGMKAYGGCGYGIFEASEDLVGYEYLCVMQYLDPDLFADIFKKIGDMFVTLWTEMIRRYDDIFVFYRMGDDLGFKSSTLLEPDTIRTHIIPQYKRVIDIIHGNGKKFLYHSCGNIFSIMDDVINVGIDAKHSNEDQIATFDKWIETYTDRIGLFGGIDVNTLCLLPYGEVFNKVVKDGTLFRSMAKGWGLGSGNSIAEYVPVDGFMAMIEAAKKIRMDELL
ncbi:MAG: uroporphyrinogen decarboxylase family protein [Bacteroidota bacterium]